MESENILKGNQEQALAAWINYLNQLRLERLGQNLKQIFEEQAKNLKEQDFRFQEAVNSIDDVLQKINIIMETNRGGKYGIHGFLSEVAQYGIGNARQQIRDGRMIYQWVNDNGPSDLLRDDVFIQMKFVAAKGNLSLNAIKEHFLKYPDFIQNGGKYQIPQDFYEKIQEYLKMPQDLANKLPTSNGEFNLRQYQYVHQFFKESGIRFDSIESSDLQYSEVQKNIVEKTLNSEKDHLRIQNNEFKEEIKKESLKKSDEAYRQSKPSLNEAGKATIVGAAMEGGMSFCLAIVSKVKKGKRIKDFESEDWYEIVGKTGVGSIKGGIRGISIYGLTNYTATPAAIASALVTASFGIAGQVSLLRKGQIDETTCIENAEILCLDAAVSGLSSLIGQVAIPIPVLGAIIGNTVGSIMYQTAKGAFLEKEEAFFKQYYEKQQKLDEELKNKYEKWMELLNQDFALYMNMLFQAFHPDVEIAFEGSIKLAQYFGVKQDEILDTVEKVEHYFLD